MEYPKTERKEGKSRLTYDKDTKTIVGWDLAKEGSDFSLVTLEYKEYQKVQTQASQAEALARALEVTEYKIGEMIFLGAFEDSQVENFNKARESARKALEEYRK